VWHRHCVTTRQEGNKIMGLLERFIDWALTVREIFGLFVLSSSRESFATDEETEIETTGAQVPVGDR